MYPREEQKESQSTNTTGPPAEEMSAFSVALAPRSADVSTFAAVTTWRRRHTRITL